MKSVRRRLLSGLVATLSILAMASCSASTSDTLAPSEPGAEESAQAYGVAIGGEGTAQGIPGIPDGDAFRVIEDVNYEAVAVPAHPQRIVTLSEPTLDGVLALGLTPIGSVNGRGQSGMPNYLVELAQGIPSVGSVAQFNFEAIAALKPDLILTYASGGNNPESVAILQRIAPVYFVGYAGAEWKTTFRNVANAVNMQSEGEALLNDFDAYAENVKDRLGEAGYGDATFSIVRWQGSNASLILKELPPGMALEAVGLKRPAAQDKEGRGHSEPISLENLQDADADYMFFGTLGGSSVDNPLAGGTADISGAEAAYREAQSVPGFRELKAYQNEQVILVDGSMWTSTGGPILMSKIVRFIEETLL